ncbi:hypothetical protein [Oharaeibacter diazotrophicus]|uniref:Tetratricopeptide repeat protein n=1 Tax=Oharaeibacter diazotrophicus TaxID=1920512 RepID=A0A4V3CVJ9_9HYPH|nr:hypothetical protein [Oharaeibacter diazotrophicus]TDP82758.1 hypothetical protein EDD54_4030 [Oharaeibacter diazotrophicus]BBE72480.1 tetratricopeptide repeat protein [Pleomorphomonas sp. SM30]GLS76511.1 hypothetical protein GCM10007904_18480 [Oharaeibacter diazotrophicus]
MPLSRLALAAALVLGCAAPAFATGPVDESALRYYAANGQTARAEAEIRRLQALYPDWQPPTDLGAAPPDREGPLWALFAADDLDGLDAAIAEAKAADPTFAPSADLVAKVAAKRARKDLIAASDARDAAKVVALAAAHPDLGGCADLDVAWRVADARVLSGDRAGASADYRRVLETCTGADARRATVQKALAGLGAVETRPLLALANPPGEFDALIPDFARAAVAAALSDPAAPAPDPAEVALLDAAARKGPAPGDAAMLGWWYRKAGRHEDALAAFRTAATLAGTALDAKVLEGMVLSLDALGRADEAYRIAADRRTLSPALADLQLMLGGRRLAADPRVEFDQAMLDDFGAAVEAARSAPGAEALGWYLHDGKRPADARRWFEAALDYAPSEAAAAGAVYAALAAKDRDGARALVAKWSPSFPEVAAIDLGKVGKPGKATDRQAVRDPILAAFERKDWSACLDLAAARAAKGPLAADQNLWRGWCLLKSSRPVEAAAAFEAAQGGPKRVRDDAVYGRSLALIAAGHVDAGAAVAASGIADTDRRGEIGVAVLANRAQARFDAKDYAGALQALSQRAAFAPETADLSLLRGWSLWHLGRRSEARRLFEQLDATYSTSATRRALATARGSS